MALKSTLAACGVLCAAQLVIGAPITPPTGPAEPGLASSGEFVIRKGKDTVAVERFTRDGATLSGTIVQTVGIQTDYVLTLRGDGSVEHVEMTRAGARGTASMSVELGRSAVRATMTAGGQADTAQIATETPPAPFLVVSFALSEQVVRASRLAPGQSARWTAVRLGAGDTATVTVTRFRPDSVSLAMRDVELHVALSPGGDVVGGTHLAQHWAVERKTVAAQ
jgi:hypothetical protein